MYISTESKTVEMGLPDIEKQEFDKETLINKISELTEECICCTEITRFKELMNIHELLLADILNLTPVKEKLFPDFEGSIKSLGAWGGDFVLAIGDKNTPEYFINKGYKTVIPFARNDIIKKASHKRSFFMLMIL